MRTNKNTFIAVPVDISETIVLKRFLDKLVEQIDIAFNNRGDDGFPSNRQVISVATTVAGLSRELNSLGGIFVALKNSDKIITTLSYEKNNSFLSDTDIVDKKYVDNQKIVPEQAPNLIHSSSSNPEIKKNADTIDELITTLKNMSILT